MDTTLHRLFTSVTTYVSAGNQKKGRDLSRSQRVLTKYVVTMVMIFTLLHGISAVAARSPAVKIGIEHTGIYRLNFEELGLSKPIKSSRLALTNRDESVAVQLDDGADGWFGPSDSLSFIGEELKGGKSHYNEFTRYNVYRLESNRRKAKRFQAFREGKLNKQQGPARTKHHLERDKLRVRFSSHKTPSEVWFWERITQIDKKPFSQRLDLGEKPGSVSFKVEVRGWSMPNKASTQDLPDHHVELYLDDELIGDLQFESQESGIFNVVIPEMTAGEHTLSIRVPKRTAKDQKNNIVDAVLLNYIEVEFDYSPVLEKLTSFHTRDYIAQQELPGGSALYGNGQYLAVDQPTTVILAPDTQWYLVPGDTFYSAAWIAPDQPSKLASRRNHADYLMISHPSLVEAIQPLAEFHRNRGLDVEIIDVDDIYDEFNHGVVSPYAIKEFISYAYNKWRGKPSYILLVGDASWDVHNEEAHDEFYDDLAYSGRRTRFSKIPSTSYTDTGDRNLIPTFSVETYDGLAASDNLFVTVDGDDFKPDLAIGRFPVVKPAEVTAIVNKLIAYASLSDVGPWRRNILWITNEQKGFQRVSDRLATQAAGEGFNATKVYPNAEEKDNIENQARLTEAFNDGQLLVHFLGHGGRYIWRTGPPDYRKNHDLFTLDNIDGLSPSNNLPMILSMTCYSAPFDHPTADSIGEKFLRLPDRGAIAVFAASWRNSPSNKFSQLLVEHLTKQGYSIGKAIMLAKQQENSRIMVETYNLLGDPASQLAIPNLEIDISHSGGVDRDTVSGSVSTDRGGRFIVDWLDSNGKLLQSQEMASRSGEFEASLPKEEFTPQIARVYFWNTETGIDAFGAIQLRPVEETPRVKRIRNK